MGLSAARVLLRRQKTKSHEISAQSQNSGGALRGTEEELSPEPGDVVVDEDGEEDPIPEEPLPAALDPDQGPQPPKLPNPHNQPWEKIPDGVPCCWRAGDGKDQWHPRLKWGRGAAAHLMG